MTNKTMNFLEILTDFNHRYERCRFLKAAFMNATTQEEVSSRVFENWEFMEDNPGLFMWARQARKRISRIQKEKKRTYKQLNLCN